MKYSKHIIIYTPGFPEDEGDDTCIPPLQEYLLSFREKHPDVLFTVVAFQYPFKNTPYEWNGIQVYPCNGRNRKMPFKLWTWEKALSVSEKVNKQHKVDFVHAFWLNDCAQIAGRFSFKHNIPSVVTAMGQDVKKSNKYLKTIQLDKHKVIALSDFQAEAFTESTEKKVSKVIPFGVPELHKNLPGNDGRHIDLLGVGSLIPLKNYSQFLRIAQEIKEENPNFKAVIIGEGSEHPMLETLIKNMGLLNNVTLNGKLSRSKVYDYMCQSKLFLHCSDYESQGYVFAEAMQCGCKIVSKPVGIAKESTYWKTSFYEEELVKHVKALLNDDGLPDWQKELPRIEDTVEEYNKIYLEKSR